MRAGSKDPAYNAGCSPARNRSTRLPRSFRYAASPPSRVSTPTFTHHRRRSSAQLNEGGCRAGLQTRLVRPMHASEDMRAGSQDMCAGSKDPAYNIGFPCPEPIETVAEIFQVRGVSAVARFYADFH